VAASAGDALIVLEGGNLTPRSGLRALAEAEACLAAIPCYLDSEETLGDLVEAAFRAAGRTVEPDVLDWIVGRLGGDRGLSRSEIDKVLLYKESDSEQAITMDDAVAVLGDTAAIGIEDVIAATFGGDLVGLDRALDRVFAEGGNAIQLVRALQRYADQLDLVAAHMDQGMAREAAMFKARGLPRGGPVRQRFERHLQIWSLPRLNAALERILRAEIECKTTGSPDEAIVRRLCLSLAQYAAAARQRARG
jgi:DNA polymerase-3 subunit delta